MKFDFEGFIDGPSSKLFARFRAPKNGRPMRVFLNGLSYSTTNWFSTLEHLPDTSDGLLLFDFRGQGKSLKKELEEKGSFLNAPTYQEQARDLIFLMDHFAIESACSMTGFSYGGGIALYASTRYHERVKKLALIAPFIIRLDLASPLSRIGYYQFKMTHSFMPWASPVVRHIKGGYDTLLAQYMDRRFQNEIPDTVFRSAAIQLSFGIMELNVLSEIHRSSCESLSLAYGAEDTLIPQNLFDELWSQIPKDQRQSRRRFDGVGHIVPAAKPVEIAQWVASL